MFPKRLSHRWLLTLSAVLFMAACGSSESGGAFNGTVLKDAEAAPGITLTNQSGRTVRLEDFRDSVVVLTFLYTNCPDVCPIVTSRLREVHETLGKDGAEVQFVAISVDPERDSVEAAREYLDKWGLLGNWQFLVGDEPVLEEVWKNYYVDPAVSGHDPLEPAQANPTPEPRGAIDSLGAEITERYLVVHSTPVFLIDRQGRRRVVFTPPLEPEEVAQDISKLLDAG